MGGSYVVKTISRVACLDYFLTNMHLVCQVPKNTRYIMKIPGLLCCLPSKTNRKCQEKKCFILINNYYYDKKRQRKKSDKKLYYKILLVNVLHSLFAAL